MKRWKFIMGTVLALLVLVTSGYFLQGSPSSLKEDKIIDAYVYPVQPGSSKWQNLTTREEQIEVTKIPEDVLATISDEGLIETILQHPMIILEVYENNEAAYQHLYEQCNGIQALLSRETAKPSLLEFYEQEQDTTRCKVLELIISQPEIYDQLTNTEQTKYQEWKQERTNIQPL